MWSRRPDGLTIVKIATGEVKIPRWLPDKPPSQRYDYGVDTFDSEVSVELPLPSDMENPMLRTNSMHDFSFMAKYLKLKWRNKIEINKKFVK